MSAPIYLDYNATTPVDPHVAAAMQPFLHAEFGNPSSAHARGERARLAVAAARAEVAALIGGRTEEIVFTGSATEANNLALLGSARARPEKRHMIVSAVEHPAAMQPALHLRECGWDVSIVPVDATGRVDPRGEVQIVDGEGEGIHYPLLPLTGGPPLSTAPTPRRPARS